jgi:hypothetical protein
MSFANPDFLTPSVADYRATTPEDGEGCLCLPTGLASFKRA